MVALAVRPIWRVATEPAVAQRWTAAETCSPLVVQIAERNLPRSERQTAAELAAAVGLVAPVAAAADPVVVADLDPVADLASAAALGAAVDLDPVHAVAGVLRSPHAVNDRYSDRASGQSSISG